MDGSRLIGYTVSNRGIKCVRWWLSTQRYAAAYFFFKYENTALQINCLQMAAVGRNTYKNENIQNIDKGLWQRWHLLVMSRCPGTLPAVACKNNQTNIPSPQQQAMHSATNKPTNTPGKCGMKERTFGALFACT